KQDVLLPVSGIRLVVGDRREHVSMARAGRAPAAEHPAAQLAHDLLPRGGREARHGAHAPQPAAIRLYRLGALRPAHDREGVAGLVGERVAPPVAAPGTPYEDVVRRLAMVDHERVWHAGRGARVPGTTTARSDGRAGRVAACRKGFF